MAQVIHVEVKESYGNKRIYPACNLSKQLLALTGGKTFTDKNIQIIKDLGYEPRAIAPAI
tara:strand:- start:124 stop:303 length:180 start_codon:yes stop_codon:yes gene_type:complete